MKHLETSIEINAAPEKVWSIITDFASFPDWNPFVTMATGTPGKGTRLHIRVEAPNSKPMEFKPIVQTFEPGRELMWKGSLPVPGLFIGQHYFRIEDLGDGKSRFIHGEHFSGLLIPLLWKGINTNVRQGYESMNVAVKERAEAS